MSVKYVLLEERKISILDINADHISIILGIVVF